jgi:hypothetical protein
MGGESTEAWRTVLDDLVKRGLRRPDLYCSGQPNKDIETQRVLMPSTMLRSQIFLLCF